MKSFWKNPRITFERSFSIYLKRNFPNEFRKDFYFKNTWENFQRIWFQRFLELSEFGKKSKKDFQMNPWKKMLEYPQDLSKKLMKKKLKKRKLLTNCVQDFLKIWRKILENPFFFRNSFSEGFFKEILVRFSIIHW